MDWLGFLRLMLLDEKAARAKYELAAGLAQDLQVKAVLERLRDEEAVHADILEGEHARLEKLLNR